MKNTFYFLLFAFLCVGIVLGSETSEEPKKKPHLKPYFSFEVASEITTISKRSSDCVANNSVVLVFSYGYSEEFYVNQIERVRDKTCLRDRFITILNSEEEMANCTKRDFGACIMNPIEYYQNISVADVMFDPLALIQDVLKQKVDVYFFLPSVVFLKPPTFTEHEFQYDFVYQKTYYNGTGVNYGQSVWKSNAQTIGMLRDVYMAKHIAVEKGLSAFDLIDYSINEGLLLGGSFYDGFMSTCWDAPVESTLFFVKNGITINLECISKKNALHLAEYIKTFV